MSQEPVQIAQELARIARENDLAEIEYRGQDFRLRLTFEYPDQGSAAIMPSAPSAQAVGESAAVAAPVATAPAVAAFPTVNSPLAGVFYRSARPGAAPFAEVGETVAAGHTLCIIEAMKLMNEIGAEVPMRIRKVLAENGAVVESGQGLFEYEPLG